MKNQLFPFVSMLLLITFALCLMSMNSCNRNSNSSATGAPEVNDCVFDARFEFYEEGNTRLFQQQLNQFKEVYTLFGAPVAVTSGYTPYPFFVLPNQQNKEPNQTLATLLPDDRQSGLWIGIGRPVSGENKLTLFLTVLKYDLIRINNDSCRVEYTQVTDNQKQPVIFIYEWQTREWVRSTNAITEQWSRNLNDVTTQNPLAYSGYFLKYNQYTVTDSDARYIYMGLMPGSDSDTVSLFVLNEQAAIMSSVSPDGPAETSASTNGVYTLTTNGHYSTSLSFFSETPIGAIHHNHTLIRACPPHCAR